MSFKELTRDTRFIPTLQSCGNYKLVDTDKIHNMRWNLPAVKTCPFATKHCIKACYARRDERYTNTRLSRQTSYEASRDRNFSRNMIYTIESHLTRPTFNGKHVYFRIHESGDFYNLGYLKKWLTIINHFNGDGRITFVAYTKSIKFFKQLGLNNTEILKEKYPNLILTLSIWDDSPESTKAEAKNYKTYTAFNHNEIIEARKDKAFHHCKCKGCGSSCKACMSYGITCTAVEIH